MTFSYEILYYAEDWCVDVFRVWIVPFDQNVNHLYVIISV